MTPREKNLTVSRKNLISSLLFGAVILGPGALSPDLQALSDKPFQIEQKGEVFLLYLSQGVTYLVHPFEPQEKYGELRVVLKSNQKGKLEIIANVSTTGNYSYEFEAAIVPGEEYRKYRFSLHHPFYENAQDFALKFTMEEDAEIAVKEISLVNHSAWQTLISGARDYWRAAPYSGFTVNLFPVPRLFGREAFWYFLPLWLAAALAALLSRKWRKAGSVGLLILWLLTDFRMNYEFFRYARLDYRTWVKPAAEDKTLRTYQDFYVFADWLKEKLPEDAAAINFYYIENEHYPRLLQYYIYPTKVIPRGTKENAPFVVFHKLDAIDELKKQGFGVLASFKEDSGIILPK